MAAVVAVHVALAAGLPASRLRTRDLDRGIHGVRAPSGTSGSLVGVCRMLAARMPPDAFFTHGTAALLLGAPVPRRLETERAVHIAVPAPARAPHAAGIRGHAFRVDSRLDIVERDGLRLAAPGRIFTDLAASLALDELVALGDHLVHRRLPLVPAAELAERIGRMRRGRGAANARAAAPLLDDRAESSAESRLRVALLLAGLPRPAVNRVIIDPATGGEMRPDLSWPDRLVAVEYHGDYHRDPLQWRADVRRRGRLEQLGWRVIEATADDLRIPAELIARIRAALRTR